jgi:hypothetical protein
MTHQGSLYRLAVFRFLEQSFQLTRWTVNEHRLDAAGHDQPFGTASRTQFER